MHERAGDLDPLAHALGIRADGSVLRRLEIHQRNRAGRRSFGIGELLEPGVHTHELFARQERVHRLAFGHEAQSLVNGGIARRFHPVHEHLACGR